MFSRFLLLGLTLSAPVTAAANTSQVQGTLTVMVEDFFSQQREKEKYFIKDQSGHSIEIRLAHQPHGELRTGSLVRSEGRLNGARLESASLTVLKKAEAASSANSLPSITPSAGNQTTLIYNLVSNVSGSTVPRFTNDQLNEDAFASSGLSVNTYYKLNSFNAVSFSGRVVGPFTINDPTTCDTASIQTQADAAAIAAGIDISNYAHRVYMMPNDMRVLCKFTGISTEGGSPSFSWVNTGFYSQVNSGIHVILSHELGHSLMLQHAQSLNADGTTVVEYGDNSCVMGDIDDLVVDMDVLHRVQEGWIPLSNVQQITSPGTYTVSYGTVNQADIQQGLIQALQINLPQTAGNLYVSYRQPQPGSGSYDVNLPPAFLTGATIQYWAGGSTKSQLASNYPWGGALTDGQVFASTDGLTLIKQISHNSTSVTIQVSQGSALTASFPTIVNSASGLPFVAPNSLASVYGINVPGAPAQSATSLPLPTTLGGFRVLVNGTESQLLYTSANQINFQVPAGTQVPASGAAVAARIEVYYGNELVSVQPQSGVMKQNVGMYNVPNPNSTAAYPLPSYLNAFVSYYNNGKPSKLYPTVSVNSAAPGTFQLNTISLDPALGTPFLSVYATGVNGLNGVSSVWINGVPVTPAYSGPQGDAGLDQINIQLPSGIAPGIATLYVPTSGQTVYFQVGS